MRVKVVDHLLQTSRVKHQLVLLLEQVLVLVTKRMMLYRISRNWPKSDLARGKSTFNSKKAGKKTRQFFCPITFFKMIKVYEYRDITKKQEKSLRSKIDTFFETGNWDKSIPPFQTYGNLHLVPEVM
jgi:hypothetical protein